MYGYDKMNLEDLIEQRELIVACMKILQNEYFETDDPAEKLRIFEDMILLGVTKEGMDMYLAGEYDMGDT